MPNNNSDIQKLIISILTNSYLVQDCLDIYEAISKSAKELNETKSPFWGLVQKNALDSAILNLSKIYDTTNKLYSKDTLFEVIKHARKNDFDISKNINYFIKNSPKRAKELLKNLNLVDDNQIKKFLSSSENVLKELELQLSKLKSDEALKKIGTYRNKRLAHHERIENEEMLKAISKLPSLNQIEALYKFSIGFCEFILLCYQEVPPFKGGGSTFVATRRVIAKELGIFETVDNIENYEVYLDWYKR